MNRKEMRLKQITLFLSLIYLVTLAISFTLNIMKKDYQAVGMAVVACITPLIIPVLFKLFKWKPVYEIYIVWIIFTYFASLVGSTFHWYSYPGFDKVLHASSGMFVSVFVAILYKILKKQNKLKEKEDQRIYLIFIQIGNMAVAALWEFYEFAMLVFFNNDAINHYSTGVYDTMTDMIAATCMGFVVIYMLHRNIKTGKPNFFSNIIDKFYSLNIEKEETYLH